MSPCRELLGLIPCVHILSVSIFDTHPPTLTIIRRVLNEFTISRSVASLIPGSSSLRVEVSLSETPPPSLLLVAS